MKWIYLFLSVGMMSLIGCGDDDPADINTIHLDGDNVTAPRLESGTVEAGAHYTSAQLADFQGRMITRVQFYLTEVPASADVLIYQGGSSNDPGTLIYEESANSLRAERWNLHDLSTAIPIESNDLWVVIRLEHLTEQQSIGCDGGPTNGDGDLLKTATTSDWSTFGDFTGTENINWNIRLDLISL